MNMKTNMSKIGLYVGIGAGTVLFALGGLLAGSFIGGSIGVAIIKNVFGNPALQSSLLIRLTLLGSMLFGVLLSGILFLVSTSSLGWLIGYTVDSVLADKVEHHAAVDSH
jgi:hypothetical protein